MQSLEIETVRALTAETPREPAEPTFAVRNRLPSQGSGEHLSAAVIAARDLDFFWQRRLSSGGPVLSHSGLAWTTDSQVSPDVVTAANRACFDVSHRTEIKCE